MPVEGAEPGVGHDDAARPAGAAVLQPGELDPDQARCPRRVPLLLRPDDQGRHHRLRVLVLLSAREGIRHIVLVVNL